MSPNEANQVVKYVVHEGNVFEVVTHVHQTTSHGGGRTMKVQCNRNYCNVSERVLKVYKSICLVCKKKEKGVKNRHVVVKPIVEKSMQHRGGLDLIDLQSMPDGEFKYILVYIVSVKFFVYWLGLSYLGVDV